MYETITEVKPIVEESFEERKFNLTRDYRLTITKSLLSQLITIQKLIEE
jgi:hypothetical protein